MVKCWSRSGSGRCVCQSGYSLARTHQQVIGRVPSRQADDQSPGMSDHPTSKADERKAHRLESFTHPLATQNQPLHRRVQVEGQYLLSPTKRRWRRTSPTASCRRPGPPSAPNGPPLPCRTSGGYHQINSSPGRSRFVTTAVILYHPPSGICIVGTEGSPIPGSVGFLRGSLMAMNR